jgi:hypothetical protein
MNVPYQPRPIDVAWARGVIAMIADGGVLAYPATQMIYRFDHRNKRMILQNPEQLAAEYHSYEIHQQTIEVFKVLGYSVEEA